MDVTHHKTALIIRWNETKNRSRSYIKDSIEAGRILLPIRLHQ